MSSSPIFSPLALSVCAVFYSSAMPFITHAQEASANALALEFAPPDIEPLQICVEREPDIDTVAKWAEWDGLSLPSIDPALIKRDMNRLMQIAPSSWAETVQVIIARLEEADPGYAGHNAQLARINAFVAAGNYAELLDQQLVAELAQDEAQHSPRIKNALAQFYRDGIGVDRDVDHANALLVDAGFSGNADALLTLTKMELDGNGVDGWDLDPSLAVTMAFGSLVGELDASICDRVTRIAREYRNGEIVQPNTQLAHDWFRFAADLGDSDAAWKVAEYHLQAEDFVKDNDLLIHYLTQSADHGLPYAQIALGGIYEAGSLVEQDLERTLELYRAAAASGLRPGLTRLALFIEEYPEHFAELETERLNALYALSELDDAAGWVFTRLAEQVYASKGRWAGDAEAMIYLERAAALEDMDGMVDLAAALVARRSGPDEFERAVNLLSYSVSTLGGVSPSKVLHGMFMCQATDSPRIAEAQHWASTELATDTANVKIAARELTQLDPDKNALTVALIQSHALYGRPRALASYLKFLENASNTDPEVLIFWQEYADRYSSVLEALAEIEFELAANPGQRLFAVDLLRQQYQRYGSEAALGLAQALIDYDVSGENLNVDYVRALLAQPASKGEGAAMRLLSSLDGTESADQNIFEEYADVIEANGDFDALLFAVPFVDTETQQVYLSRANGIIPCNFRNVIAIAEVYLDLGDRSSGMHWVDIAENLIQDETWAMVSLAEAKLELYGVEAAERAMSLYESALALGSVNASRGIFDLSINPQAASYDPARVAQLISNASDDPARENLAYFLGRYRRAAPVVQAELEQILDIPQVVLTSAEAGDIFSMRVYGMYLRDNLNSSDDLIQSTQWLARAAEGGDTTAMAEYGYSLAFGIGTKADLPNAVQWLEKAAENGSVKAASITALLKLNGDT